VSDLVDFKIREDVRIPKGTLLVVSPRHHIHGSMVSLLLGEGKDIEAKDCPLREQCLDWDGNHKKVAKVERMVILNE